MSKEKQIEEIANMIYDGPNTHGICWRSYYERLVETIYNAGYRKEDDIAKEIFEKLYANIKFNGHTVSVWKNNLIEAAKEYEISLE